MCTCHACSYNTRDLLIGYITSYGNGYIEGSVDIFGHMDFFISCMLQCGQKQLLPVPPAHWLPPTWGALWGSILPCFGALTSRPLSLWMVICKDRMKGSHVPSNKNMLIFWYKITKMHKRIIRYFYYFRVNWTDKLKMYPYYEKESKYVCSNSTWCNPVWDQPSFLDKPRSFL